MVDVAIILGSQSDEEVLEKSGAKELFEFVGITYEVSVIRHEQDLRKYVLPTSAKIFIATMSIARAIATIKPYAIVFALTPDGFSGGKDALYSMMRTPRIPVAVCGGILNTAHFITRFLVGFCAEDNQEIFLKYSAYFNKKARERPAEIKKEVWDGKSTDGN